MSGYDVDPTRATAPELNRRAFVGIAAAAVGAGSSAVAAAQTAAALGGTHPPLVPENDPSIRIVRPALALPDASVPAYAALPKDGDDATPSVVVVMHVWGVDTSIRDVVRRFAKAGIAAIAPDLYARFGAPAGDGVTDVAVFRPYAKQLERTQYDGDLAAAAAWLKAKFPATKTGIAGFCMGGRIALLAAIDDRAVFAAVCPFYGPLEGVDPKQLQVPVCASYGARDRSIPADSVRAFAAALTVPNDVKIYDAAGHAFFDDQRSAYVAPAAEDAWARTLAFLRKYEGPES
jgi:carboxymethylenebutenolidase